MFNETIIQKHSLQENAAQDVTEKWLLLSSPIPILVILITYLSFVLKIGPAYMRHKSPFNLKIILVIYNIVQVIISVLLFCMTAEHILQNGLILQQQCYTLNKQFHIKTAAICYFYFLAKISELLDTIFFVLRKRDRQVSFLHVYHHTFTVAFSWYNTRFSPAYSLVFVGTVNSFVHIIMYAYYGLAAFPNLAKYLWWKKYITKMQLVQFFILILHLLLTDGLSLCDLSKPCTVILFLNYVFFVYLFLKFYAKEYFKSRRPEKNVVSAPAAVNSNDISDHKFVDNTKFN